ncbi:MAG: hypothetical protein K2H46_00680 [Muribaculaceae bacterium]|nr:hypothetical protein [Muribaculaceae bacterium]
MASVKTKLLAKKDSSKCNQDEENPKPSLGERIGKWDITKNNLHWIFGLSAIVLIGLFIVSCFNSNSNITESLIGTIGSLASLFGIYLTLCQVIEAKKDIIMVAGIANATKTAAEETKQSIRKTISIAQLAKYCEQIKFIQEKLNNKELNFVIHLIHDLQDAILELQKYLKSVNISFDEGAIADHIKKMGMNITFIRTAIERGNEKYKRNEILKDFDDLLIVMSELKAKLTTHDNEQPQISI